MNIQMTMENLKKHGFDVRRFSARQEAVAFLSEQLENRAIGFGGSITLRDIGLYEELGKKNVIAWLDRNNTEDVIRFARNASIYITGANAISESSEIVNIDYMGNLLGMMMYGPEKVYIVTGTNKIVADKEKAIWRAKNIAAPHNAKRFGMNTPCPKKADKCYDCNSPERLCSCMLVMERRPACTPIEIILIDESLGF
ncbi:MAG: lactate utilization protein [Candidatus Alectryocaccobium sp.]|jgi:hypothetical protein